MIDQLELNNFQSHKKSIFNFHPGVNAIVGPSNNGKTAVIRGLKLARYNAPSGDAYISKWARDQKGKQIKQMNVVITKNNHVLIRGKGPELNGYQIDDNDPLEALGKGGLPLQVVNFFDTNEVNLQEQMDKPFLIGSTPPEIAKFLNTIVDMSEIDVYLSAAESKKRSTSKDIKRVTGEIASLEKQKVRFNNLEDVQILISKLEKIIDRRTSKIEAQQTIKNLMTEYTSLINRMPVWGSIDTLESLLDELTSVHTQRKDIKKQSINIASTIGIYNLANKVLEETDNIKIVEDKLKKVKQIIGKRLLIMDKALNIANTIVQYKEYTQLLSQSVATKKIMSLLDQLESIKYDREDTQADIKMLKELKINYLSNNKTINSSTKGITNAEKQLPTICPTCGASLHKEITS